MANPILKMAMVYLNPKNVFTSLQLLFTNDTAKWYTFLGDEVLEGLDEKFTSTKKPLWLNIGYWKNATNYSDAGKEMALLLSETGKLSSEDLVLDVGFGYGEQDILWAKKYSPKKIHGINITPLHVEIARKKVNEQGLSNKIELAVGSATELPFENNTFTKVMALESAFHFRTREKFFKEALRVLKPGGKIVLADMLPNVGKKLNPYSTWLIRRRAGLPQENYYDRNIYREKLAALGFKNIEIVSIRDYVYPGMYKHIMARYAGQKMEEINVKLTVEEIKTCAGVAMWEKSMGFGDYVICVAEK